MFQPDATTSESFGKTKTGESTDVDDSGTRITKTGESTDDVDEIQKSKNAPLRDGLEKTQIHPLSEPTKKTPEKLTEVIRSAIPEKAPEQTPLPQQMTEQQLEQTQMHHPSFTFEQTQIHPPEVQLQPEQKQRIMQPNDWLRNRKAPSALVKAIMNQEKQEKIRGTAMPPNEWLRRKKAPAELLRAILKPREEVFEKERQGERTPSEAQQEMAREELEALVLTIMKQQQSIIPQQTQKNYKDLDPHDCDSVRQKAALETLATILLAPVEHRTQTSSLARKSWVPLKTADFLHWPSEHRTPEYIATLLEIIKSTPLEQLEMMQSEQRAKVQELEQTKLEEELEKTQYSLQQEVKEKRKKNKEQKPPTKAAIPQVFKIGPMAVCVGQIALLLAFFAMCIYTLTTPSLNAKAKEVLPNEFNSNVGQVKTHTGVVMFFVLCFMLLAVHGLIGFLRSQKFLIRIHLVANFLFFCFAIAMVCFVELAHNHWIKEAVGALITKPIAMAELKCCGFIGPTDFEKYSDLEAVKTWKELCKQGRFVPIPPPNSTIAPFSLPPLDNLTTSPPPQIPFKVSCDIPIECCEERTQYNASATDNPSTPDPSLSCTTYFTQGCQSAMEFQLLYIPFLVTSVFLLLTGLASAALSGIILFKKS